ncbi:hypothetical protein ACX9NE_01165 [Mycobacterium sp. ML4]
MNEVCWIWHRCSRIPTTAPLVYCCGPEALLDAVEQQCAHWPAGILHIERFAAKTLSAEEAAAALEQFEVVCQRSGVSFEITSDQSVLEVPMSLIGKPNRPDSTVA